MNDNKSPIESKESHAISLHQTALLAAQAQIENVHVKVYAPELNETDSSKVTLIGVDASRAKINELIVKPQPPSKVQLSGIMYKVIDPIHPFHNRQSFLQQLHSNLHQDDAISGESPTILSRLKILSGLGGVGKTETVRKYISLYKTNYRHVVWIDAENEETMTSSFLGLANLKMPWLVKDILERKKDVTIQEILPQIYENLCRDLTLLIFDNAEQYEDRDKSAKIKNGIAPFLPTALSTDFVYPFILVTSRNQDWGSPSSFPDIRLEQFSDEESAQFILQELQLGAQHHPQALNLAHILGGLPLALHQAVAYIRQEMKKAKYTRNAYPIQNYIDHFLGEFERRKLLEWLPQPPCSGDKTVSITWDLTLKKINEMGKDGEMALEIIEMLALFPGSTIANEYIFMQFKPKGPSEVIEGLMLLEKYALIRSQEEGRMRYVEIHRMVQSAILEDFKRKEKGEDQLIDLRRHFEPILKSNEATTKINMDDYMKFGQEKFIDFMDKTGLSNVQEGAGLDTMKDLVKQFMPSTFVHLINIIEPPGRTQKETSLGERVTNFVGLLDSLTKELSGSGPAELLKALGPTGLVDLREHWDPNLTDQKADTTNRNDHVKDEKQGQENGQVSDGLSELD